MALNGVNTGYQGFIDQNQTPLKQSGLFKNRSQSDINLGHDYQKDALDSIDRLLNRVMDELNKSGSLDKATKIIEQVRDTRIAPNLAKDLQSLSNMLENDDQISQNPILKELSVKLKEFLKPITDLKSTTLNEQIRNSGIMLEANLKEALNSQKLPASVQKLLSDIKNLSSQNLLNEIINLAKDESLDTKTSLTKLNELLTNARQKSMMALNSSPIKGLFSSLNKLDDMAKFLNKLNFNVSQNGVKLSGDSVKNQISKIFSLSQNLSDSLSKISSEKLNQSIGFSSNLKEFTNTIKELQNSLNMLNKIGNEQELLKSYMGMIDGEGSLQDKLQSAARRLAQTLNFIDHQASNAKTNLDEIKGVFKQLNLVSNDTLHIEDKSSADIAKTLNNDIKSTLLSLQDKSANLANSQQINQATSKMISQIELHQIISSLSGGISTYLPYVWDDVDSAKVAFKRGKKDKYYAQIDLNFKHYGQVNVMTTLSEKRYIDISMATQYDNFKLLIRDSQNELKEAIRSLGLMVSGFSIKTMPKNEIKKRFRDFEGFEMGYDVRA